MADFVKGFFGQSSSTVTTTVTEDADFADFAASTVSTVAAAASSVAASAVSSATFSDTAAPTGLPGSAGKSIYGDDYPWYAFWLRSSPKDFTTEYFVLAFLGAIVACHLYGTRTNRSIAQKWIAKHAETFQREFALFGFGKGLTTEDMATEGAGVGNTDDILQEESPQEFIGYASGRLNVLTANIQINLMRRSNPFALFGEWAFSFFFESMQAPSDSVTVTLNAADGADASKTGGQSSKYDGFVWGIVNKNSMSKWRNDRYDLSLTKTVDNAKLPEWATIMTESAEITDTMLTTELIKAVEEAGTSFQFMVISDQPIEKPTTLAEFNTIKKRLVLQLDLPTSGSTVPLVQTFLRLPDFLVSSAHFRPEVMRKVKATRDEEKRKLEKIQEEEKAEERITNRDIKKKEERDEKLRGMTPEQSRKFLEKEKEKEQRKMAKRSQRKV